MNSFFKHLSLSAIVLSLFANINTRCMYIKKLAKTSTFYSLRQKYTTDTINSKELESKVTQFNTKLDKLESDLLDIQKKQSANEKHLNAAKKSLEKIQEISNAMDSDIHTLEKCIENLESGIETLEPQVLLCSLKKLQKQSGVKTYTKPATKEDLEKFFAARPAEPFDEEVLYWEPMTPEMIEIFRQSLAGTLEDYERRKRDGGGVY